MGLLTLKLKKKSEASKSLPSRLVGKKIKMKDIGGMSGSDRAAIAGAIHNSIGKKQPAPKGWLSGLKPRLEENPVMQGRVKPVAPSAAYRGRAYNPGRSKSPIGMGMGSVRTF